MVKRILTLRVDPEIYEQLRAKAEKLDKSLSELGEAALRESIRIQNNVYESIHITPGDKKDSVVEDEEVIIKSALKVKESSEKLKALIEQAEREREQI